MRRHKEFLGIDPGLRGGIAFVSDENILVETMPRLGKTYDLAAIRRLLDRKIAFCLLEKQQAMPKQGGVSMFTTGFGFGIWHGLLTGLGIPHQIIAPRKWQNIMLCPGTGNTKERSVLAASNLFPNIKLTGPRGGILDGRADALLLAELARRMHSGQNF